MFKQLCKQHFPIILFWQPIFKSKTYNHAVTFAWLDNLENILNAIVERQICKLFEIRTLLTMLAELYYTTYYYMLYVWGIISYLFFFFILNKQDPFWVFVLEYHSYTTTVPSDTLNFLAARGIQLTLSDLI